MQVASLLLSWPLEKKEPRVLFNFSLVLLLLLLLALEEALLPR